jgi:Holliday junction resolvase
MPGTTGTRSPEIAYLARKKLESLGYNVLRNCGTRSPVDLFAWRGAGHLLLIRVRNNRHPLARPGQVHVAYREDIASLLAIDRPSFAMLQLWLWTGHTGFRVFEVLVGGIREVGDHE